MLGIFYLIARHTDRTSAERYIKDAQALYELALANDRNPKSMVAEFKSPILLSLQAARVINAPFCATRPFRALGNRSIISAGGLGILALDFVERKLQLPRVNSHLI